jgi:hypothetical protein
MSFEPLAAVDCHVGVSLLQAIWGLSVLVFSI